MTFSINLNITSPIDIPYFYKNIEDLDPDFPPPYYDGGIWNRLEGRPRKQDFSNVLNAEIADPLFMMTRQWQFGEFNMEDTGSSILAKLEVHSTNISRFKGKEGNVIPYNPSSVPMEVYVERQPVELSYKDKVALGDYLLKLLKSKLNTADFQTNKDILLNNFTFEVPEILSTDTDEQIIVKTKTLSNVNLVQYLEAISGRKVDGNYFLNSLNMFTGNDSLNSSKIVNYLNSIGGFVEINTTSAVIVDFVKWVSKLFSVPNANDNSWDKNKLEYAFEVSTPEYSVEGIRNPKNAVLSADEYYQGELDWYNFVKNNETPLNSLTQTSDTNVFNNEALVKKSIEVVPALAKFAGMPANRFWQFEDSSVNFGKIDASTSDVAKVLLVEFALVHQDDWMIIPYELPIGTSSNVAGIVVTDVFGINTHIEHVSSKGNDWEDWNMYNLTREDNNEGRFPADTRVLIPPTLTHTLESQAIEKVVFLRDEMSNLVWAIEKNVDDQLGSSIDGGQNVDNIKEYLSDLRPNNTDNNDETKGLSYQLGTSVAFNWIPFIPVHVDSQNRKNKLQRASMPLLLENYNHIPIRPNTKLLRYGIGAEDQIIHQPNFDPKYFIHEEEITRSGIEVLSKFQRTRWIDGKTYLWYGFTKRNGRGEGNSGLSFDNVNE